MSDDEKRSEEAMSGDEDFSADRVTPSPVVSEDEDLKVARGHSSRGAIQKRVSFGANQEGRSRKKRHDSPSPQRPGESNEEWQSRLAVEELERTVSRSERRARRELRHLRERQARESNRRRRPALELVSPRDQSPVPPPRPVTPPGPPESQETVSACEMEVEKKPRHLQVIRHGVMFGNLRIIPTDPDLDPPFGACQNCWRQGHNRRQCPDPVSGIFCWNCGRRGATLQQCIRCSERHRLDMEARFGSQRMIRHRERRSRFYQAKRDQESTSRVDRLEGQPFVPQKGGSPQSSPEQSRIGEKKEQTPDVLPEPVEEAEARRVEEEIMPIIPEIGEVGQFSLPDIRPEVFADFEQFAEANNIPRIQSVELPPQVEEVDVELAVPLPEANNQGERREFLVELRELTELLRGYPPEIAQEAMSQFLRERKRED